MKKFLSLGMILLLSTACLPHIGLIPEKTRSDLLSTRKEQPSLFTPGELETFFSSEPVPSQTEASPLAFKPPVPGLTDGKLELPISDESSDDFNLEILPEDHPNKGENFDIPIVMNAKVEHFIHYFQTTAKNSFANWLARSEKYIPFMKSLLKENGLPEDLVYLALIESGFNPYAYSRSKASGPWQFIYLTGKRYGLKVNGWVDERRDPEKSTIAAAKYLKDLYDMFECWYLAAAGYNAGENRIASAIKRYRTEDFWELAKYRYLKQETRDYVPQMIAAALIAKDPERYGFTGIEYQEPLRYDRASVPPATPLSLIARVCETSVEEIKSLNPELSRWCTPPDIPDYEIKIPFGKKELFTSNFESLQPLGKMQFKTHTVKKGETLSQIARLYRIGIDPIVEINRLKKTDRLSTGMNLLLPIPRPQPTLTAKNKFDGEGRNPRTEETTYIIQKGDTLWSISSEMGINIGALSRWNNLHPEKKLTPGDKLKIRMLSPDNPSDQSLAGRKEKQIIYVVKSGDTLWSIAKKHNLSISQIQTWNHLGETDRIYPEARLKLRVDETKSSILK